MSAIVPAMPLLERVVLRDQTDVMRACQVVRRYAVALGLTVLDRTKIVTAASELARNMVIYGGGGIVIVESAQSGMRQGLRAVFEDHGPGIADIERALQDGYTSGKGLGLGLGGARRLVHDFAIESVPGQGTRIMIARWR